MSVTMPKRKAPAPWTKRGPRRDGYTPSVEKVERALRDGDVDVVTQIVRHSDWSWKVVPRTTRKRFWRIYKNNPVKGMLIALNKPWEDLDVDGCARGCSPLHACHGVIFPDHAVEEALLLETQDYRWSFLDGFRCLTRHGEYRTARRALSTMFVYETEWAWHTACAEGRCDEFFDHIVRPTVESLVPGSQEWKTSDERRKMIYSCVACTHVDQSADRAALIVDHWRKDEVKDLVRGFTGFLGCFESTRKEQIYRMSRFLCILHEKGADLNGVFGICGPSCPHLHVISMQARMVAWEAIDWCKRWFRCTVVCHVETVLDTEGVPELVAAYAHTPFDSAFEEQAHDEQSRM